MEAMRALISSESPAPSTITVFSLSIFTWRAEPSMSMVASFSSRPSSSVMTWPPVRMAISCSISLRRSPKPGAFTATQVNVPRSLFSTRVARASPSTSSAMMSSFLPCCTTCSSRPMISWMLEIFLSVIRISGLSSTASIFSMSVHI